jgi:uncharacterized protein with GYD domain
MPKVAAPTGAASKQRIKDGGKTMTSYVMLFRYTHQGLKYVKHSPDRLDTVKKLFEANGAKAKDFLCLLRT